MEQTYVNEYISNEINIAERHPIRFLKRLQSTWNPQQELQVRNTLLLGKICYQSCTATSCMCAKPTSHCPTISLSDARFHLPTYEYNMPMIEQQGHYNVVRLECASSSSLIAMTFRHGSRIFKTSSCLRKATSSITTTSKHSQNLWCSVPPPLCKLYHISDTNFFYLSTQCLKLGVHSVQFHILPLLVTSQSLWMFLKGLHAHSFLRGFQVTRSDNNC